MSRVGKKIEIKSFDRAENPSTAVTSEDVVDSLEVNGILDQNLLQTTTVADVLAELASPEPKTTSIETISETAQFTSQTPPIEVTMEALTSGSKLKTESESNPESSTATPNLALASKQTAEQATKQTAEQTTEQTTEQSSAQTLEQASEKAPAQPLMQIFEQSTKLTEQSKELAEQSTEPVEQSTEPVEQSTAQQIERPLKTSEQALLPESTPPQALTSNHIAKTTTNPRHKQHIFKRLCSGLSAAIVLLIAICAATLVGMRLAGFRTFTVMSGSMSPEYPVGSLIYVQPVDYKSLKAGDVISYVANDDKTIVTHRITEVVTDEKDPTVLRYKTKGDANASADAKLVHYRNVLGTPVITLPLIGYFAHNIQQPPGIYIALVVGTLLLAWTFLPNTLEERRKTARTSTT